MKRIILAACLALGACTTGDALNSTGSVADAAGVPAPAVYANRTAVDESALYAMEAFYKAARIAVETGVDAGLIKGAAATQVADLDNKAYLALTLLRSAYRTANSASYLKALTGAQAAIQGLLSLTGRVDEVAGLSRLPALWASCAVFSRREHGRLLRLKSSGFTLS